MLDASLENFLEVTLTGERYKLFGEVISYLESIEYSTIQDELMNMMFTPLDTEGDKEQKPESTVVDEIHIHLQRVLESQLLQSGITVAEGTELKDIFDLAVGISLITTHEDVDSIIAATCSDSGTLDQLADILELVTTHPAEQVLMVLDSVSPQLLTRIREIMVQPPLSLEPENEEPDDYLPKLRIYSEYCSEKERSLKALKLVGSTILGRPFETYINSGVIDDLFDGNEMNRLALELYCMALMSSDARTDPPMAIRNSIERYLNDAARTVKVNAEVAIINAEFVKFYQTTSKGLTN